MTPQATLDTRKQLVLASTLGAFAAVIAVVPDATIKAVIVLALTSTVFAYWVIAAPLRWIAVFLPFAWLLPPLPFELGNSGPHVAVAVAGAGLVAGLVRLQDWEFRLDWLTGNLLWLMAVFTAGLAFAFAYSGMVIGFGSAARLCLMAIAVYAFLYIRQGPGRMRSGYERALALCILYAGALSALLACIDFYYQLPAPAGYGPQFIWLDSGVFRRAQGVFYEASTLGNVCAFVLEMIAVALVLRPKQLRFRTSVLTLAALPLGAALVLSYSRASLVNVLVAMTVLLWLVRSRVRILRAGLIAGVLLAIGTGLLWWLFPTFFDAYLLRAFASLQYFAEAPNAVLSGRLQTWNRLAEFIEGHPLQVLLGIGYKTLPYSNVIGSTAIADNTYLSVLVECGIAGLSALLTLNIAILAACYRAFREGDATRSFFGAWFLCFWAGQMVQMMSADLLTYWRALPAYFCVLALATREMPAETGQ